MNTPSQTRLRLSPKILAPSVVLILLGIFALTHLAAKASPPAPLDETVLTAKALTIAQRYGLQGNPTAQKVVRMTLGEWDALVGVEEGAGAVQVGLTTDLPVFVLAIRGNITWHSVGMVPPNQPFDN